MVFSRWTALFAYSMCITVASAVVRTLTAVPGDEVIISCRVTDSHSADWWFRCRGTNCAPANIVSSGILVDENGRRFAYIIENETTSSLLIRDVRSSDTGSYSCIGDEGRGDVDSSQLAVFDTGTNEPTIQLSVFAGDAVVLPCHVDKAHPAVDWWYQQLPGNQAEHIVSAGFVVDGFAKRYRLDLAGQLDQNLIIENIQPNEYGLYTCIAESGMGRRSSILINVYVGDTEDVKMSGSASSIVELPCETRTTSASRWLFSRNLTGGMSTISLSSHVCSRFADRVVLNWRPSGGAYNIVLRRPSVDASGWYICVEDFGAGRGRGKRFLVDIKAGTLTFQSRTLKTFEPSTNHRRSNFSITDSQRHWSSPFCCVVIHSCVVYQRRTLVGPRSALSGQHWKPNTSSWALNHGNILPTLKPLLLAADDGFRNRFV